MKKFTLILGLVAASFTSNADYLYWQVTAADAAKVDSYEYVAISYKVQGSQAELTRLEAVSAADAAAGTITTDLQTLKDKGGTYSIFVELLNYDSKNDNWNQVGVTTGDGLTYSSQATSGVEYIDFGNSVTIPAVWHGGAINVPEPTSGMMVMMGLAFLALKRRKA